MMPILSLWQDGKPPMPGWWLLRFTGSSDFGRMFWFDGSRVRHGPNGFTVPEIVVARMQYRGLAFDPNAALEIIVIDVPSKRTRRGWTVLEPPHA